MYQSTQHTAVSSYRNLVMQQKLVS